MHRSTPPAAFARLIALPFAVACIVGSSMSMVSMPATAQGQHQPPQQQDQGIALPVYYEGDGLILSIEGIDQNTGSINGRLMLGQTICPYAASFTAENAVRGSFSANGQQFEFTTVENADDSLSFTTGNSVYTLRMVAQPSRPLPGGQPGGGGVTNPPHNTQPGGGGAQPPAMGAVTLQPHALNDSGMNNTRSHTLLVPEGWQVQGGVQWTPELYKDFVHMNLTVSGPGGAQVTVTPGGMFEWSDIYDIMAQQGAAQQRPQPGQNVGGMRFMPMPDTTTDYIVRYLLPSRRPQAQNVQIVDVTEMTDVLEARRQLYQPILAAFEQNNQMLRQQGGSASLTLGADRIRVTYTENGVQYQEEFTVHFWVGIHRNPLSGNVLATLATWMIEDVISVRSPVQTAQQNMPVLHAVAMSLQPDPQWQATIMELRARINRQEMEAIQRRGEIRRQANEEMFARHQESIRSQNEARDRSHHQFINYIRDVQQVRMPNGQIATVPSTHSHIYSNGNGGVVLSHQPIHNAGQHGLTPVQPIR